MILGEAGRNHAIIVSVLATVLFFLSPVHAFAPLIYYFIHDMIHQPVNEYRAGEDISWGTHARQGILGPVLGTGLGLVFYVIISSWIWMLM